MDSLKGAFNAFSGGKQNQNQNQNQYQQGGQNQYEGQQYPQSGQNQYEGQQFQQGGQNQYGGQQMPQGQSSHQQQGSGGFLSGITGQFNNATGGQNQYQGQGQGQQLPQGQGSQQTSGGGNFFSGIGDKFNTAAGGGRESEKNEDYLDKGVDFVQQRFLGQGPQDNESAVEQAKDEQISDFIRDKYKSTTGKDFFVKDKETRFG